MADTGAEVALPIRCAPELQDLTLWRQHAPRLRELYLIQNKTLKQVKKSMEEDHGWPGFKISTYEVVLRNELKLVKNLRKDDWVAIQHRIEKRARNSSKQSEVIFCGRRLDPKRIAKETRRYRPADTRRARSPPLRDVICITTPPSLPQRLPALHYLRGANVVTMTGTPSNVIRAIDLRIPTMNQIVFPMAQHRPLSLETILEIRTSSPFNHFAMQLQDGWQSNKEFSMYGTRSSGSGSRTPTGSTGTYSLQLHDRNNAHHRTLSDDLGGISQIAKTHATDLTSANDRLGTLMGAFFTLSNNMFYEFPAMKELLDWVGLVADMKQLKLVFSYKAPTVTATWENLILQAWRRRHGKAFDILVEIGLAIDKGRLMQSQISKYFALAVQLGSRLAAKSVHRLLKAGVPPDAPFPSSGLPSWGFHNQRWCSCALEQASKKFDADMLEILVDAGASPISRYDNKYGNALLSIAIGGNGPNGQTDCLKCIEFLIDAGVKVDFVPGSCASSTFTTRTLGWKGPGRPRLLIDRLFLLGHEDYREVHECIARHSEWWNNCVTVSGIFQATEAGLLELQRYLASRAIPNSAGKQALLQIALSEAAYRNAATVTSCLAEFGVDLNVEFLMTIVPEDQRRSWSPVLRAAASWSPGALTTLLEHGASCRQEGIFEIVFNRKVNLGSDYTSLQERRNLVLRILLDAECRVDVSPECLLLAALIPLDYFDGNRSFTGIQVREYLKYVADFQPDFAFCNKLQQYGISVNLEVDGVNTLQMALRMGCNFATADFLIHSGVRVHSVPHENDWASRDSKIGATTMLHDALLHATVDVSRLARLLVQNGADVFASTTKGISVLETSLCRPSGTSGTPLDGQRYYKDCLSTFWWLFGTTGPHCCASFEFKLRPLASLLVRLCDTDANILAILGLGVDINEHDPITGRSLLIQAIRSDRIRLAKELIERGCDVNFRVDLHGKESDDGINSALMAACLHMPTAPIVRLLLENGADVNEPCPNSSMTPLHHAAVSGSLELATILLQQGAVVNAKPGIHCPVDCFSRHDIGRDCMQGNWHAVDGAAYEGHLDMVHLLVGAGGISGFPGETGFDGAMHLAKRSSHHGVLECLQQHTHREYSETMRPPSSPSQSPSGSIHDEDSCYSSDGEEGEDGDEGGPEEDATTAERGDAESTYQFKGGSHLHPVLDSTSEMEDAVGTEDLQEDYFMASFNDTVSEYHPYDSPGAQRIVEWAEEMNDAFSLN